MQAVLRKIEQEIQRKQRLAKLYDEGGLFRETMNTSVTVTRLRDTKRRIARTLQRMR